MYYKENYVNYKVEFYHNTKLIPMDEKYKYGGYQIWKFTTTDISLK
jgi:hypothetical protein